MLLAVPLLVLCLIVAIGAVALAGERLVSTRRSSGTRPPLLVGWRGPSEAAAVATVAIALGIPLMVLVREAIGAESLRAVLEGSGPAIANSLLLATIGATAVVGLAVWLGYARARARGRLGQLADVLFVMAFAVPSTIVGVGLIGLWNRPGLVGTLYGTDAMFILGYLARFVPVTAMSTPIAEVVQIDAAVVRPRTLIPSLKITPAPRKPMPVMIPCAMRVGSIRTSGPISNHSAWYFVRSMRSDEARQTSACVRKPAGRPW